RDDLRPSIFFGLQLAGESLVAQGGRQAVVRPGELVIFDSTRPSVLTFRDGIRGVFRIPLDRLALPHDAIRRVLALTLSPGHPVTDVAATYFRRLASRPDLFAVPGAEALSEPSIELMRAVIATHLDAAELGKDALKATLPLRILEYARAHLRDPHLGVAQVAAAHHISKRHLYNILGASGITLADWIRTQRLQRCRKDIAAPAFHATPIASIARGWGFTDPSSFTRMFKNAYAMSPREWRHQTHTRRSEPTGEVINQECSSSAQHCAGPARSVDPSAGNGRIVVASKTTPQIPAVSVRTALTRACRSIQQMSPEKGPGVSIFINGEKRCPGTEVLDRAIRN